MSDTLHDPAAVARSIDRVIAVEPALALGPDERDPKAFFNSREPGFAGLIQIILEQQVSVKAGQAMWRKLTVACPDFSHQAFLELDDDVLKSCGFSRQKMVYARGAATALDDGSLKLTELEHAPEAEAMAALMALKGIGRWTAEVYLLSCLGRMDIWPAGDLALVLAVQHLQGMAEKPTLREMDVYGARFAGDRSVASLLTWHYYRRHLRPNAF